MRNEGLHWFWRAAIAMAAGCAFEVWFVARGRWDVIWHMVNAALTGSPRFKGHDWAWFVAATVAMLPGFLLAFATYGVLTRFLGSRTIDLETRCRKCGYILRGITEPRCPECGEHI